MTGGPVKWVSEGFFDKLPQNPPEVQDGEGAGQTAEIEDPFESEYYPYPGMIDKAGLLKDLDARIFNLEICEISVKSGGDYRAARDCRERVEELKNVRDAVESEDLNTKRIGEDGYGVD